MTSKEVIQELQGENSMTIKMVRVLMNRLCEKGLLSYTVDAKDKRVSCSCPMCRRMCRRRRQMDGRK